MTEVSKAPTGHAAIVREKPLMNMRQILLMNLGFFGIQYSFGMQQTAVNPIAALELLASGDWKGAGVLGPEAFPAQPFLSKLAELGAPHSVLELDP